MDAGLLVLRLAVGLLIAGHGIQKVTPWIGGKELSGGVQEFRDDGFRGGTATAIIAGGSQVGAGLLLAAGALLPPAAAGAIGVMTVAVTVKWRHGLWAQFDGYEYPLVLVITCAALAMTGPGRYAADSAADLD